MYLYLRNKNVPGFTYLTCFSATQWTFLFKTAAKPDVPVTQWQSIALAAQKVVGSIPKEHTYWQKMYSLNAL